MEANEREILISRRVELVEDIDIQGGLFTQLLSRKVLLRRTVNKIKLNHTPEEQVEELLNELPKRECFEDFCQALIADGQEHIVKKYLKAPLGVEAKSQSMESASAPVEPATVASQSTTTINPEEASVSSRDSSTGLGPAAVKRQHSSASGSSAMICIREEDNRHLYITYRDQGGASPEKRKRALESGTALPVPALPGPVTFEPDETRYAMKHFVSQETGEQADGTLVPLVNGHVLNPQLVLKNPQSIVNNPNIADPLRYSTAFPSGQQWPSSILNLNSAHPLVQASLINPASALSSTLNPAAAPSSPSVIQISAAAAPPSPTSSPLKDPSSRVNQQEAENARVRNLLRPQQHQSPNKFDLQGNFVRLNPGSGFRNFQSPEQYLNPEGLLNSPKSVDSIYNAASLTRSPSLNQNDAVDSHDNGLVDVTSENLNKFSSGTALAASPSIDPGRISCSVGGGEDSVCDMDQIDLPDGCVNVKVEHCTRQFFMANHKKAYPMRQIPRGLALIINVDEVKGKPARKGTNFDRDNLCNLLCQLHFNIIVYNDKDGLSAQEMVNKLKEFAKLPEHADMDACFVCLLSHGEEGFIFGTDGKRIPLEEIFMLFGNTNCKGLIGKPKVFIIQACRGGYLDKGVRLDEVDGGSLPASSSTPSCARIPGSSGAAPQQLPSMSDMLVCYPTLTGYYAWRNRARGSWYIEAIVQVFMRYAKCEDVCAMLNRVNQLVSKKVSECNQKEMNAMSQMSEYKSSLRQPHLFLFPGIGICMRPPQ